MNKYFIAITIGLLLTGCGNAEIASQKQQQEEGSLPTEEKLIESEVTDIAEAQEDNHQQEKSETEQVEQQSQDAKVQTPSANEQKVKIPSNDNEAVTVIANPSDLLVLVNKKNSLPASYVPSNLVAPDVPFYFSGDDPKRYLRPEAAEALELLFAAAQAENIELLGASGYRSYSRQEAIFASNVKRQGEEAARKVSAVAGQSEHQTGLAIDLTSKEVGYDLIERFGETKEGIWLKENAHKFGFIIRYPKGKEDITGYSYEPWHIRYIGNNLASDINSTGLTLEEYFSTYPVNGKSN